MQLAHSPEQKPLLFAAAMNAADLDSMLSYYAEDAIFVPPTGPTAKGQDAIRQALISFLTISPKMQIAVREVHQTEDTALVIGDWTIDGRQPDGAAIQMRGTNVEVQRLYDDGGWRCIVDKPAGTASQPA
jgi:uncharacterized protein (TIGR02246 family)